MAPRLSTLALASATAPGFVQGSHWLGFAGKKCDPGQGADYVQSRYGPINNPVVGHKILPECQEACMMEPGCEGVSMVDTKDAYSNNCYFRRFVDVTQCEDSQDWNIFIAPKSDLTRYEALGNAWRSIHSMNCYPGKGATLINNQDALPGHRSLVDCQKACQLEPTCDGLVWHDFKDAVSANCYLRANVDLTQCVRDEAFNMRLKPIRPTPPMPPIPTTLLTTPGPPTTPGTIPITRPATTSGTTSQPTTQATQATTHSATTTRATPTVSYMLESKELTQFTEVELNLVLDADHLYNAFQGVIGTGDYSVFVPHFSGLIGLYHVDPKASTWSTRDISNEAMLKSKLEVDKALFVGGGHVGTKAIFAPYDADCVGVFDVGTKELTLVDISKQLKGDAKFRGGTTVGSTVVFAPYYATVIGYFDADKMLFHTFDISGEEGMTGTMKFSGCAASQGKVVFAPFHTANIGIFDVASKTFTILKGLPAGDSKYEGASAIANMVILAPSSAKEIAIVDVNSNTIMRKLISDQVPEDNRFQGASSVGSKVYFAPNKASAVGVYDVVTFTFSTVAIPLEGMTSMKFSGAARVHAGTGPDAAPVVIFGPTAKTLGRMDILSTPPPRLRLNADLGDAIPAVAGGAGGSRYGGWVGLASCAVALMLSAGVAAAAMGRAAQRRIPIRTLHYAAFDEFTNAPLAVECDSDSSP